ncbi:MAG: 16S rRNA (guanine(966)-N(2))-methyltransferase RsmD [Nitrospirae bacterium]|nr:MAG: 16S rRNA (guanine(966)-N(2))-methyltransferase RsmD [Nitrospirota bacterium]
MRISSGALKGRKLGSQKLFRGKAGSDLRPTSSKVREALFDILARDIPGAFFLDLYAGTGTVGMEALSRGAARSCFVETEAHRISSISDSAGAFGLADRVMVRRIPVLDFLKNAAGSMMTCNVIFADPPYASEEIPEVISLIDSKGLLSMNGCLVIEHASKTRLDAGDSRTLQLIKNYKYGDTMLTLFRRVS